MIRLRRKQKGNEADPFKVQVGSEEVVPVQDGDYFYLEGSFSNADLKKLRRRYGFKVNLDPVAEQKKQAVKKEAASSEKSAEMTIKQLKDRLNAGEFDHCLEDLFEAEKKGKNRRTALNAIESRVIFCRVEV